jgi:tetratricopeptide (TPR) repeat protein
MFLKKIILLFLLFILIASCSSNSDFRKHLKDAIAEKKGNDLLNELYSLDQKYSDELEIKVNIGAILIAEGDIDKAAIYLKKGEELTALSWNKTMKAILYAKLSELSYRQGNFNQGIAYANKSLEIDNDDPLVVNFTKAKCLYFTDRKKDALSLLEAIWDKKKEIMDKDDMNFYLSLLRDNNEYRRAIKVSREFGARFDYQVGLGIIESVFYEKLGMIDESIISAAKDLEYGRYTGGLTGREEFARLSQLNEKIVDNSLNPGQKGTETIKGLISYISEKWDQAGQELMLADLQEKELPFYIFLVKSSRLESGKADEKDFSDYKAIEKYFRSFPDYYYHLYKGMNKAQNTPDSGNIRNAMEACILLAPTTSYAKETRIELGKLLGLKSGDGEKLLLGPELDRFYLRLSEGQSPAILSPVMDLLSLPDNIYTLAAVFMLKKAKQLVSVKEYLEDLRKIAKGSLKERLNTILTEYKN